MAYKLLAQKYKIAGNKSQAVNCPFSSTFSNHIHPELHTGSPEYKYSTADAVLALKFPVGGLDDSKGIRKSVRLQDAGLKSAQVNFGVKILSDGNELEVYYVPVSAGNATEMLIYQGD